MTRLCLCIGQPRDKPVPRLIASSLHRLLHYPSSNHPSNFAIAHAMAYQPNNY